jgi:hypothetical protein
MQSIGWVVHEDEEVVTVVPHVDMTNEDGCGEMVIMKAAIIKRRRIEL